MKEPALSSCKEILANQNDYKQIRKILIKRYGKLSVLHQNLSKHHANIGQVPSLHGNAVPWPVILSKTKAHIRLIQKAQAIENHLEQGETFINATAYIGNIVSFLPHDYQISDDIDDASDFTTVKSKFDEILHKAELMEYSGSMYADRAHRENN